MSTTPKPIVIRKKLVKPQLKRDKLPIANYEHDFIKRLEREKILVVEASTGSGKSTQLPQYVAKSDLFQAERRKAINEVKYGGSKSPLGMVSQGKMVVSTQPNAFAAAAVATRVGYEYDDDHLGRKVGLITPTESRFDPTQCEILFVSDSELVRIMTQDKLLSRVGVLIIDEAHERTLYTDVIMTLAKEIREQRDDFYIVISSATIEVKRFLSFMFNLEDSYGSSGQVFNYSKSLLGFRPTPLTVLGKTYEVQVMYDPMQVRDTSQEKDPYLSQILVPKIAQVLLRYLDPQVRGHALAFVEDTQTVLRVVHHLRNFLRMKTKLLLERGLDPTSPQFLTSENTRVIPLYLSMPLKEQQKIMDFVRAFNSTSNVRYVFIADNVAETSITLPDVKLVVDTGRMMISTYDIMRRLMVTEETFVSKDRASQRQGRTGRTSPGLCVRLYNETDLKMDRVEPDIKRVALDKVALQLAAMNINPKALRLIEPPEDHKFIFAIEQLIQYKCLVSNAQHDFAAHLEITDKGRVFVQLPFAPDTCEQLWQASLISAEATTIMHAISCLFNNESSNLFEHSPGMTWKQLAHQIIQEEPFQISPQVGIDNNILSSQHWTPQQHLMLEQQEAAAKMAQSTRGGGSSPNPATANISSTAQIATFNPLLTNPNPLIIKHNDRMVDLPSEPRSRHNPHVWYNPFWQTNPELKFGFNLNSGSDLELGYFMYIMLLHYQKPGCAQCTKRGNGTAPSLKDIDTSANANPEGEDGEFVEKFSVIKRNRQGDLNDLGLDKGDDEDVVEEGTSQGTDYKRCNLCSECEGDFAATYRVLPTAIKQAENFIRSTRDLVHRSLCRNYSVQSKQSLNDKRNVDKVKNITNVASSQYKQHPEDYPPTRVMTHCIYTALSHMAGVTLVTNHLAEGVVLPHKYFKMVKATIDPNACSNTVDTYYKLITVDPKKLKKTRYVCVKNFVVIHVTARKAHDYNITCLHPFDLNELLPLAQEVFSQNVSSLQLQCVLKHTRIGRGLYSSIDYVLSNQRIDNMARQYDLEKSHLRQQALAAQGNMAYKVDDGETTRNMEAMNWSRFAAIPWHQGVMSIHTLSRYNEETVRRINDVIVTASRHTQHLFERERRSYRLPLSNIMSADVNLSHDFSLKELIIHVGDKSFAVRPGDISRNAAKPQGPSTAALFKGQGNTLGSSSAQKNQIGLGAKLPQLTKQESIKEEDALAKEFGMGANVAAVATDIRDLEQHWRDQVDFNDDEYAAALDGDDEDDDIEMLDDDPIILPTTQLQKHGSIGSNNASGGALGQPMLLQQRSLDRLPSGTGISITYSQATDRQKNEQKLATAYDPLQLTRFTQNRWQKHDAKKNYTNTLALRRRIDITSQTVLAKLCSVWDLENNPNSTLDQDNLRSISPLREVYSDVHTCFEEIIKSLRVLHQYQYFPLIPEFSDYSSTVENIFDQSTALLKFQNNTDGPIKAILQQYSSYDEESGDYFIASLLDIQHCFVAIVKMIEKAAKQFDKPHLLAQSLLSLSQFKFSIFVSINFELGPRDLISWIQLAPRAGQLFDLQLGASPEQLAKGAQRSGVRRFIAPNPDRLHLLSEPIPDGQGGDVRNQLFGSGYLVDPSDLRLLQTSEEEVKQIFSSTLNIAGFDCLYMSSATVDHSEIIDVSSALDQIKSTLIELNGKANYQLEVLERLDIVVSDNAGSPLPPHIRTQVTFAGNQATVLQSVRTLLKVSEPSSIPLGPLTNSTNALLSFMMETTNSNGATHFDHFLAKHNIAAEYIRHGSDGSLSIWGSAQGVHSLDTELKSLVAQYEKRRQAFPLPHNIFADLKNCNENSPFYSAYEFLTEHIDHITGKTAKYQLKTDESAFILETMTPEHLTKCLQAIRGFKSKCSIEDDSNMAPCFICLQRIPGTVQRLATCDHPICGACLAEHTQTMILNTRQRLIDEENERQMQINERMASAGLSVEDQDVDNASIARAGVKDELYAQNQQQDQNKLLQQLKMTYSLQCPCFQSRAHGADDYYVSLAAKVGVTRPKPTPIEMQFGKGCEYSLLPSDIMRICTPSQIHQVLFLLAKPVMKATNAYLPCPSASCNTLLPLVSHYQQCPRCGVGTCTQCNITTSSLHQIVPCHIFKGILSYHDEVNLRFHDDLSKLLKIMTKMNKDKDLGDLSKFTGSRTTLLRPYINQETQTRLALCKLIGLMTQKYLDEDWLKHSFNNRDLVSKIPKLYLNPGLFSQCGSYIRFIRGCKAKLSKIPAYHNLFSRARNNMLDYDTKTHYALLNELFTRSSVKFAYHGTPRPENVPLIMHHGLDPKFRAGQVHGPGEYLGVSPSVSFDYGREFFVVVMFLNIEELYTLVPNFCFVIKNESHFDTAYCLPVGVIRVSDCSTGLRLPEYPPSLDLANPGVAVSTASWLANLGLDPSSSLSKAFFNDEKAQKRIGIDMPKGNYGLQLDIYAKENLSSQDFVPDPKLYAKKAYKS